MRPCVTSACNLNCPFCRPGGESAGESTDAKMSMREILQYIRVAASIGVWSVKYSGGEPLCYRDKYGNSIVDIIEETSRIEGITEIQMVTNGVLLSDFASRLANVDLDLLTVSLETLIPEQYAKLTGQNCLEAVVKGILNARQEGIPLRINTIVMKSNADELWHIIDFARKVGAELKLLDLLSFQVPKISPFFKWEDQYFCNYEVRRILEARADYSTIELPQGEVGSPMVRYFLENGVEVLVKDSTIGTHYGDICTRCKEYPCQDGLYNLRITANRKLKRCWASDEYNISLQENDTQKDIRTKFEESLLTFVNSKFERKWKPLEPARLHFEPLKIPQQNP